MNRRIGREKGSGNTTPSVLLPVVAPMQDPFVFDDEMFQLTLRIWLRIMSTFSLLRPE